MLCVCVCLRVVYVFRNRPTTDQCRCVNVQFRIKYRKHNNSMVCFGRTESGVHSVGGTFLGVHTRSNRCLTTKLYLHQIRIVSPITRVVDARARAQMTAAAAAPVTASARAPLCLTRSHTTPSFPSLHSIPTHRRAPDRAAGPSEPHSRWLFRG